MLFNPDNKNIYVANVISNSISVIDSNVNEVTNDIEVGINPVDLEFNPSTNYIYVANEGSNPVSVIDTANNNT